MVRYCHVILALHAEVGLLCGWNWLSFIGAPSFIREVRWRSPEQLHSTGGGCCSRLSGGSCLTFPKPHQTLTCFFIHFSVFCSGSCFRVFCILWRFAFGCELRVCWSGFFVCLQMGFVCVSWVSRVPVITRRSSSRGTAQRWQGEHHFPGCSRRLRTAITPLNRPIKLIHITFSHNFKHLTHLCCKQQRQANKTTHRRVWM